MFKIARKPSNYVGSKKVLAVFVYLTCAKTGAFCLGRCHNSGFLLVIHTNFVKLVLQVSPSDTC